MARRFCAGSQDNDRRQPTSTALEASVSERRNCM
jgi:hypothetical protein